MSFIATEKASLGNAVLKGSMTPTSSTPFTFQQNQLDLVTVSAVASQETSIGIRVYSPSLAAQKLYGYSGQPGDFVTFNAPWNSTQAQVAADLITLINAHFGATLTLVDLGAGLFTIATNNQYGLIIEYANPVRCTVANAYQAVDLLTYEGQAILIGSVVGGDIYYSETVIPPDGGTGAGAVVEVGNPFDIIGIKNITTAQVIEADPGAPATVYYQIYLG